MTYRSRHIPQNHLDRLNDPKYGDEFEFLAKLLDTAYATFKLTEGFRALGLCSATNEGLHRALPGKRACRMHGGKTPQPNRNTKMNIQDFTARNAARFEPLPQHIREQLQRLCGGGNNLYFTIMVVAQ